MDNFHAVILIGNKEVNNQKDIKHLFSERQHLSEHDMNNYVGAIFSFLQLSNGQSLKCENCIREKKLSEALKSMPNEKSARNDGLTK